MSDDTGSVRPSADILAYRPENGEKIRVHGLKGNFEFVRIDTDKYGDFAVVRGGQKGHRLERCVPVNRLILSTRKRRRPVTTLNVLDVQSFKDGSKEKGDDGAASG